MPEFAPSNSARNKAFKYKALDNLNPFNESSDRKRPMSSEAARIAEAIGGKVIGAGAERVVIERPDGKVLGIYRYPLRDGGPKLKQQFYTSRILNSVFPQFYPHVYAAGTSSSFPELLEPVVPILQKLFPEYLLSFTVTEKINRGVDRTEQSAPDKQGEYPNKTYLQTRKILDDLDIDLITDDEPGKNNVGKVYTDGYMALKGLEPAERAPQELKESDRSWSTMIGDYFYGSGRRTHPLSLKERDNLMSWMRGEKYSDEAIHTVETSFDRLLDLQKNLDA